MLIVNLKIFDKFIRNEYHDDSLGGESGRESNDDAIVASDALSAAADDRVGCVGALTERRRRRERHLRRLAVLLALIVVVVVERVFQQERIARSLAFSDGGLTR